MMFRPSTFASPFSRLLSPFPRPFARGLRPLACLKGYGPPSSPFRPLQPRSNLPYLPPSRHLVFASLANDTSAPEEDVFSVVKRFYLQHSDQEVFLNFETKRAWTARAVINAAESVAVALSSMGFSRGDRLCIFATNCPEFAVTVFATWALGGVVLPANTTLIASELKGQVNDSGSTFLACTKDLIKTAAEVFCETNELRRLIILDAEVDAAPPDIIKDSISLSSLMEFDSSLYSGPPEIDPFNDIAVLPYSSGTTGLPKGIMLTHHNVLSVQYQILHPMFIENIKDSYTMGLLPFYHGYGLFVILLNATLQGSTVVTLPKFEAKDFLQSIQDYKMPTLPLVPPLVVFMAKDPIIDDYDLSSVKTVYCAAAPLSKDTELQFLKRLKVDRLRQGYGLSESLINSAVSNLPGTSTPGSSGMIFPNTKLKILDIESGKELGYGEEGEICVRGPQVMKGYLNNEKATDDCIDEDGWLHTGDVGYFAEDQNLFVTDRVKELIKYKGHQVAPATLESLLLTHKAVADAAVIGVPSGEDVGELPKAFVVLKTDASHVTAEEIQGFVKERTSPFGWLRGGVDFVASIPKAASGKILRRLLRNQ